MNGVHCPRCGCNDTSILSYPSGAWMETGRARCTNCGMTFGFREISDQTPPPIDHHNPPPLDTRTGVRYQILCCEDCDEKLKIQRTNNKVRYLKCPSCGKTFKISGEDRVRLTQ